MSKSDRNEYIARETLEWARHVLGAGDLDFPDLIEVVFHLVLTLARPGAGSTPDGQDIMIRLLSGAAMAFINQGASYGDASRVFEAVGAAVGMLDESSIQVLDATSLGAPLPSETN